MSSKKGIVDPWRIVDPIKPPPRNRVDIADVDRDEDLRPTALHVFRCRTGGVSVKSNRIETEEDALRVLVACLFEILELPDGPDLLESAGIRFSLGTRKWEYPGNRTPNSRLAGDGVEVYFFNRTLDQGIGQIMKLLCVVKRRGAGAKILNKHGVSPLLK